MEYNEWFFGIMYEVNVITREKVRWRVREKRDQPNAEMPLTQFKAINNAAKSKWACDRYERTIILEECAFSTITTNTNTQQQTRRHFFVEKSHYFPATIITTTTHGRKKQP